ncbi:MAG: hypothetical protein RIQ60_3971 [Pseudomonadota bacterium]|jgi:hypothetical protein
MSAADASDELCAAAARLVVDEGMEYGPAKHKAARVLGLRRNIELPDNLALEDAVREHIALFCADTQPAELLALRELALLWMERLAEFRPLLVGAVWRGTATRLSPVRLRLYCDDAKAAELALLNRGVDFDLASEPGPRGAPVDVLVLAVPCRALNDRVTLQLSVLDHDDVRGQLKPDARGQSQAGDAAALRRLLAAAAS